MATVVEGQGVSDALPRIQLVAAVRVGGEPYHEAATTRVQDIRRRAVDAARPASQRGVTRVGPHDRD